MSASTAAPPRDRPPGGDLRGPVAAPTAESAGLAAPHQTGIAVSIRSITPGNQSTSLRCSVWSKTAHLGRVVVGHQRRRSARRSGRRARRPRSRLSRAPGRGAPGARRWRRRRRAAPPPRRPPRAARAGAAAGAGIPAATPVAASAAEQRRKPSRYSSSSTSRRRPRLERVRQPPAGDALALGARHRSSGASVSTTSRKVSIEARASTSAISSELVGIECRSLPAAAVSASFWPWDVRRPARRAGRRRRRASRSA